MTDNEWDKDVLAWLNNPSLPVPAGWRRLHAPPIFVNCLVPETGGLVISWGDGLTPPEKPE